MRGNIGRAWLAAGMLAVAGCTQGTNDTPESTPPAVDVNGEWNVKEDGADLGIMTLVVTPEGDLGGELETLQGGQARLYGAMEGFDAEFTMVFPAEFYTATLRFNAAGTAAAGKAVDNRGFARGLAMTRRTAN